MTTLYEASDEDLQALLDEMTSDEQRELEALIEEESLRAQYRQQRLDNLYMAMSLAEMEAPYLRDEEGFMTAFYRNTEVLLN